ncbi:MAG TPA: hypothetical protein VFY15_02295 [Acidimicrobiia bacterium]|nr:hypothetical protein [Acidimicrobiia bacterium]
MSGLLQAVIAVAIGLTVFAVGRWGIRLLAQPGPEEPDPEDVVEVEVPFRCTVCGLRLTVTAAQDAEVIAPRHCREEMEPA